VSNLEVEYSVEPQQNIALARNKAVQNAKGDFIAFIDDDEFPDHDWLLNLYWAYNENKVDGVLGPVKPVFQADPPRWIIKSKLCERSFFKTGVILNNSKYTRTGNVLLHRRIFNGMKDPFDLRFGRSGGEDAAFFKRSIEKGYIFVWCNEACVYETISPERLKRAYFLNRAFLRGIGESKLIPVLSLSTVKSLIGIALYTFALPFLFVIGHHLFMKFLIKNCDHLGKILGLCGLKFMEERAFYES
jgi:glycosyltransferase involved in cell wall biosynthesis